MTNGEVWWGVSSVPGLFCEIFLGHTSSPILRRGGEVSIVCTEGSEVANAVSTSGRHDATTFTLFHTRMINPSIHSQLAAAQAVCLTGSRLTDEYASRLLCQHAGDATLTISAEISYIHIRQKEKKCATLENDNLHACPCSTPRGPAG